MRKALIAVLVFFSSSLMAQEVGARALSAHTILLTCTASNSTCVAGYMFYRGTTPGGESTTSLNPTATSACSYTDATVQASTTYYYTAKAYGNANCPGLSIASNEATATTPAALAQPQPPTGFKVGTITREHGK
jgi:hypothetical protein